MTIVFERTLAAGEHGTHAFVIGVGSYPHLAKGGANPPDLESAVSGAKLFVDWLITHADALRPKLASIDLILSPPGEVEGHYAWPTGANAPNGARDPRASPSVEPARESEVKAAGVRWRTASTVTDSSTALLYACGHGVATPTRTMVFLSDLNADEEAPWNPHIDIQVEVARMRRHPKLGLGCVFVDACQEIIKEVILADADTRRLIRDPVPLFSPGSSPDDRTNVFALVPGPRGALAFDDGKGGGGRYTHVLLQALGGAAVKNFDGRGGWGVMLGELPQRMKWLHGLRRLEWPESMDPTPLSPILTDGPIVEFKSAPRIPVCLTLRPSAAIADIDRLRLVGAGSQFEAPLARGQANGAPAALVGPELLVAWPPAAVGAHFIEVSFVAPAAWPNSANRTQIDISEMRVVPLTIHDVG